MRVLVTGATGFIAGHCIEDLLRSGYSVRGTCRRPADEGSIAHLRALAATHGGELELVEAHLDRDGGWRDAVRDCEVVLHTASPLPTATPLTEDELIRPAVDGTRRVLDAALDEGVRRLVLTSSTAAIVNCGKPDSEPLTAEDWSDPAACSPYAKSKTLAEQTAWDLVSNADLELVTVNPCLVLGPLQRARANTSVEPIRRLLARALPAVPHLGWTMVDVRDVATAHRLAFEVPEAAGQRFLLASEFCWMRDAAQQLKAAFGPQGYRPPTLHLPYAVLWLAARFDPGIRSILDDVGRRRTLDATHTREVLGWQPRPIAESIRDTGQSLIDHGIV